MEKQIKVGVGVMIVDDNKILLGHRVEKAEDTGGIYEPDCWTLPGGKQEYEETMVEAAIRECKEEIGVDIKKVDFFCTYPNTYVYKNIEYKTCDVFFTTELPSEFETIDDFIKTLKPQESEVQGFASFKVESMEDIEKIPLAFESAKKIFEKFIKR